MKNAAVEVDDDTREFIRAHRVARLATSDRSGQPSVIPICYVFDGERIYSPLDEKPKSVAAARLKRVRNIEENPQVAMVIDDYAEDWSKLSYTLVRGRAEMVRPAGAPSEHARAVALLKEKYPQYRSMRIDDNPVIKITITRVKRWTARNEKGDL